MKKSHFNNEKGLTLIELLGAIGLFAIVIVLSATALTQAIGNQEKVSHSISLNKEMNLAINDLRNQYKEGMDKICISDVDIQYTFENVQNGTSNGNCIEADPVQDTLSFTLTASNGNNQTEISTAFEKKSFSYSVNRAIGDKPPNEFTEEDDISGCIFEDNTLFNKYVNISTNGNQNKAICDGEFLFMKSVAFFGGLNVFNHNTIVVNENMYVIGNNLSLSNHVKLVVKGNLYIQANEQYKPNARIEVHGQVCKVEDINKIKSCEIEINWK
ncbi:type II secretion system protein [Paucisalibacillus globulus]|uniref:type II secretion system protein n=1 Tax=Paucisalibacillus globulus TaxID=351095 RepID=UPI000BB682AA|nr:type II secretion system protein [Paucisalibacillus globulus]